MSRKILKFRVAPFIGGLLYAASFPMFGDNYIFGAQILGMALLFNCFNLSSKNQSPYTIKSEALSLLLFCIGYCLLGYYWIPETLRTFGNVPLPIAYFLGLFFSVIIAPQYIVFLILHRLKRVWNKASRLTFPGRHILIAAVFTVLEYYTPQQFPAHMGHPWLVFAPYLYLSTIFGAPLFSFLSFWFALALVDFINHRRKDFVLLSVVTIVLVINLSAPLVNHDKDFDISHNLRLVQANIGNFLKVSSEKGSVSSVQEVDEAYEVLSTLDFKEGTDLIIWPETAYPKLLNASLIEESDKYLPGVIKRIINRTNTDIFFGGYDQSLQANDHFFQSEYNSAFHLGSDKTLKSVYHKVKLIPFGEELPFGPFNKSLSRLVDNIAFFAPGDQFTLFKTNKGTPFTAAICYEILFSSFIRTQLAKLDESPHFIINLTNDSWYGDTSEPYQHLFLSKWRALEFQLPIVRITNTGITSIIYPDASESQRLGVYKKTFLDTTLKTKNRTSTVFEKYGLIPLIILIFLLFGISEVILRRFKTFLQ